VLIFVDDSGDPGFKLGAGSSDYFVISLVIFDDDLAAEAAALKIKQYRRALGFPDNSEFKFNKSRPAIKEGFLNCINDEDFRVRSLVVSKQDIYSAELRSNKNSFYSYVIKLVLQHSEGTIENASIKIDGSGDRIFRKSFICYLRKELNQGDRHVVKNCKLVDSKSNVLIQMADMVAGAVRRSYDESKRDHSLYKDIISNHIEDEWLFQ
jgi:hypothetical protein